MRKLVCVFLMLCSSLAPAQVFANRVRVSEAISQRLLIKKVPATYPASSSASAVVVLTAVINKDGAVEKLSLVSGDEQFVPSAISAAKRYKYKPYYLNGAPVVMDTQISIAFVPPKK